MTLVTPAADVSNWTHNTMEQHRIQGQLMELGVALMPHKAVTSINRTSATLTCAMTGRETSITFDAIMLVTAREPDNALYVDLVERSAAWSDAGIESVTVIGDAMAPATIAHAVYAGHRYGEELDAEPSRDALPFRREVAALTPEETLPAFD